MSVGSGTLYRLLAPARHASEVKHSRFVAIAVPIDGIDQAMAAIGEHADPAASHNCWAYRLGDLYRSSDDGEPGGTAGRPILQAIDGQRVDRVVVLVIRYFGGIKLGAGGLVRAYGGCAASCLRAANKIHIEQHIRLHISCDFSYTSQVHARLLACGGSKRSEQYTAAGLELDVQVPAAQYPGFAGQLAELSRGTIRITEVDA